MYDIPYKNSGELILVEFCGEFSLISEVDRIEKENNGYIVDVKQQDGEIYSFSSKIVINSAGLYYDNIAKLVDIDIEKFGYKIHYFKGIYYRANKQFEKYPRVLIYPVPPGVGAVGIHTTPDCYGGMRLGPHFTGKIK